MTFHILIQYGAFVVSTTADRKHQSHAYRLLVHTPLFCKHLKEKKIIVVLLFRLLFGCVVLSVFYSLPKVLDVFGNLRKSSGYLLVVIDKGQCI